MTYFESILLGLVQGLGEFLPISSSAHLVILPWFVKFKDPGLAFDVALHFGTLLAVVAYFWRDWWQILFGSGQYLFYRCSSSYKQKISPEHTAASHMLLLLFLATIPAAIAGFVLDEWAETTLRQPLLVAINMIVLGAVLFAVDRKKGNTKGLYDISLKIALLIGFSQILALFPGVSRSGITITMALLLGVNRQDAARFSFLLSTPIIFGACLLKIKHFAAFLADPIAIAGVITAAIFGFLSIKYLLKLVQNYSFAIFCYYRFLFGFAVIYLWIFWAIG